MKSGRYEMLNKKNFGKVTDYQNEYIEDSKHIPVCCEKYLEKKVHENCYFYDGYENIVRNVFIKDIPNDKLIKKQFYDISLNDEERKQILYEIYKKTQNNFCLTFEEFEEVLGDKFNKKYLFGAKLEYKIPKYPKIDDNEFKYFGPNLEQDFYYCGDDIIFLILSFCNFNEVFKFVRLSKTLYNRYNEKTWIWISTIILQNYYNLMKISGTKQKRKIKKKIEKIKLDPKNGSINHIKHKHYKLSLKWKDRVVPLVEKIYYGVR
jgi:hypothetical protein